MRTIANRMLVIAMIMICSHNIGYAEMVSTMAEYYERAQESLGLYLTRGVYDQDELEKIEKRFDRLDSYEYSNSYMVYVKILKALNEEDFSNAEKYCKWLNKNEAFVEMLAENGEKYRIGKIGELTAYISGREAEAEMKYSQALISYSQCLNFYDTYERLNKLSDPHALEKMAQLVNESLRDNNYNKAVELLKELVSFGYPGSAKKLLEIETYLSDLNKVPSVAMSTATDISMPAPTDQSSADSRMNIQVTVKTSSIHITWDKVRGARKYALYRSCNGEEWKRAINTEGTEHTDVHYEPGSVTIYYIEAYDGSGKPIGASEQVIVNAPDTVYKKGF